jgi:hypothetical protein
MHHIDNLKNNVNLIIDTLSMFSSIVYRGIR